VLVESIGRWWPILAPVTAVVFAVALDRTFDEGGSWTAAAIGQVAYAWLAIIVLMGLFRTVLARERPGVRYLSDSAYWLYLAHLPIVIWGQIWIRSWDLPATLKFLGLTSTVTVLLLISYQLFVRYTPLGTLLNGKRTRPVRVAHHASVDRERDDTPAGSRAIG
jgi:peptidoglycan/LPS O-acetylase OafA/YrhL